MIEITPTEAQKREARLTAGGTTGLQGSITRGGGSPAGALGEIVVRDLLGYKQINTAHYDLLAEQGTRIDVKTKRYLRPQRILRVLYCRPRNQARV